MHLPLGSETLGPEESWSNYFNCIGALFLLGERKTQDSRSEGQIYTWLYVTGTREMGSEKERGSTFLTGGAVHHGTAAQQATLSGPSCPATVASRVASSGPETAALSLDT